MRKLLLGTSALIGATALVASASAAPELTISGGLDFQLWGGEAQATSLSGALDNGKQPDRDRGPSNSGWEFGNASSLSEIRFHAEAETDGGTSYGANFQYRYLGSSTDEAYLFVSGDWGTVHLGQDDGAVDAHAKSADSIAPGPFLVNGWATSLSPETNSTGDNRKISYFSNDLSGFKFGVSVTGDTNGGENSAGATLEDRGSSANNGAAAYTSYANKYIASVASGADADARAAANPGSGNYEDVFELAANYTFGYSGGSATISYGIYSASAQDGDNAAATDTRDDLSEASLGFVASFGDFSVAGSVNSEGDSGLTTAQKNAGAEGRSYYDFGIAYNIGGGMAIGLSYAEAEWTRAVANSNANNGNLNDTRTQSLTAIDFGFPIMDGMSGFAGIAFSDYESDVAALRAYNTEATTYVIGTSVSF